MIFLSFGLVFRCAAEVLDHAQNHFASDFFAYCHFGSFLGHLGGFWVIVRGQNDNMQPPDL
jgi:hypothetical protein